VGLKGRIKETKGQKTKGKKEYTTAISQILREEGRTMARATTRNQGSKAFSGRDPVAEVNHPLGEAPASGAGSSDSVAEALAESEEDYPPSAGDLQEDCDEEDKRNSGDEEADETTNKDEEGTSLSDLDEALSDGASSYGDEPAAAGSPNLQDLVRLGQEHCRSPCTIKNKDGVKTASVCGKTVVECARHAETRLGQGKVGQGKYRYEIGAYSKVRVSRGFTGHGMAPPQGLFYTEDQLQVFRKAERDEMSHLVQGMNDDLTDKEEMDELAKDLRSVKFKEPRTKTRSPLDKNSPDYLRKALAADTRGTHKTKKASAPSLWFGMTHPERGEKWLTLNPAEANLAARTTGCRIDQIFHSQEEAEAWLNGNADSTDDEGPPNRPRYDSDGFSLPGSDCNRSARRKVERRRTKKQARKALERQSTSKKAHQRASNHHKAEKKKVRKSMSPKRDKRKPRKSLRSSKKRAGHKEYDSTDSSSSASSGSDSDSESGSKDSSSTSSSNNSGSDSNSSSSTDSSTHSHRRSSRHKKEKSKKSRKSKKPRPKTDNFHKYQNDDPSKGDPQRIYGMSINGTKIDKEIAPDDMRRSDRATMYTAAVDVTSLPGGWNSNKGVSEEMFNESQKIVQLTSSILASSSKARGMEIQDTSWNSSIRHSLGKVKHREDVFEFVKKLGKSKKAAFKQEGNLIQHFLYERQYAGTYIREYARSSLLNRITDKSFTYFFTLADAIRQLAYNHPNWEGGPAKAMLSFHSEKMLEIRQFAVSRKQLILQIYAYLRDSHAKDFYHESMSGALWERIGDLSNPSPSSGGGGGATTGETTRCGWCNNKDLHKLLNIPGQKNLCPFKNLAEKTKAREGAKWVMDQRRADPAKDTQELLQTALSQFA
jgi:hypothetical protein